MAITWQEGLRASERPGARVRRFLPVPIAIALAFTVPAFNPSSYLLTVLTLAGIYVALATSYDLVAGQLGALSLVHPAFFAIGAYAFAILVTREGMGQLLALVVAAVLAAGAALLIGIPSFRLTGHSFGVATLGILVVLQLVATNSVSLTNGPSCVSGVPPLQLSLGGVSINAISTQAVYYGAVVLAILAYGAAALVGGSRTGRAFRTIRENEALAKAHGVHALRYKLLAFVVAGGVAGVAGAYYSTALTLVCPSEFGIPIVINLLIIVFLGGAGSLRAVALAAIVFTALPELLRAADSARLVIFGLILLVGALYMPEGFAGLIRDRQRQRRARRDARAEVAS